MLWIIFIYYLILILNKYLCNTRFYPVIYWRPQSEGTGSSPLKPSKRIISFRWRMDDCIVRRYLTKAAKIYIFYEKYERGRLPILQFTSAVRIFQSIVLVPRPTASAVSYVPQHCLCGEFSSKEWKKKASYQWTCIYPETRLNRNGC